MNTNERKPLLSEAEVERMLDKHDYRDEDYAMKDLWRYYEDLITEGKLRVVEEVTLDATIAGFLMCPQCKRDMREDEWDGWEFCTCGNKIKQ